jgi:protein TonB
MTHALAARAASFGASLLLMSGLLVLALSMSYAIREIDFPPSPAPVEVLRPPIETPPPEPARSRLQAPPLDAPTQMSQLTDLAPLEAENIGDATEAAAFAGPVEVLAPRWLERPRNLAAYYPPRALARNIEGAVRLNCLVRTSGLLECAVVSETPTGWGFGEAAMRIAHAHRMAPAMRDGAPVEGRYAMRVPFQID